MKESDPLTPGELIDKYPAIKKIGWTSRDIGQLLSMGLLKGKRNYKRESLIDENSLLSLVKFRNELMKQNIADV